MTPIEERELERGEPEGFEAGMLDYHARVAIRDLIRLHGFEEAREKVAFMLNDECERKPVRLYLDIETIPSQSPEVHARIAATITPPGNISKAETIAAWEAEKKPALVKEAIAKTALDGSVGHICCIGWAFDDEPVVAEFAHSDNEDTLISVFTRSVTDRIGNSYLNPTVIGHNVVNFDIRFLWQRAIILGIRMPQWFPRDPKPWGNDVFDTMTAFAGARGMIGMDRLCQALGMDGKGDVDGSMIGELWAAGEFEKIASYCRADVERTRAIHRRMQIAFGEAA